ncbi:MotA/TolQ/ExbB proton channel family protein [Rhizobium alvei]|uniref:MotA/TolQ/ExbB proton channel family protein n=1 Tax=Rhizobium alvei TaxID=1132659 RepID=A0ABT8YSJ5_9HYPH|nr:MotA/TolQ/ExbB proton channel family protein [Rhizobium alvei]MDO6966480.1 MotA/TolQ/ExbB proton channel family protein [Rhizobium alvei]
MPENIVQALAYRASAYALVAALGEALTLFLFPIALQGLSGTVLIATIISGPMLSGLCLRWPGLIGYAAATVLIASLAVGGLALGTIDFAPPEEANQQSLLIAAFASLSFWPVIVTGLLAGGALDALATASEMRQIMRRQRPASPAAKTVLEQFVRSSGALVNYAIALTLTILSITYYGAGAVGAGSGLAWLVATPIHLAILVLFAAICCVLFSIWLDAPRQIRSVSDAVYPAQLIAMRSQIQRRFLKTLIALLPVMGFLGTVWGIKIALSHIPRELFFQDQAGDMSKAISDMTKSLKGIATAFETTLLGLLGSIAATLALAQIERAEAFLEANDTVDPDRADKA